MGRLFLIKYDQSLEFYQCRYCEAHICLRSDMACHDATITKGIFVHAVNVIIDGPERYRMEGANRVANVHCSGCNSLLGLKFIEVHNNEDMRVREGRFEMPLNKLFYWDGNELYWIVVVQPD